MLRCQSTFFAWIIQYYTIPLTLFNVNLFTLINILMQEQISMHTALEFA